MAYTVLARRYRSATFSEVVGQDHVARTLGKAIESGRVAHAFLFNGTRGVGKTSMARILAKALNCHNATGPTPTPCLKCESCNAIARGEDIDVIEIDAASNTGVDNIREIIENAQYRPVHSRFKVYIIDEVHMLSKSAFNALLKTLEEPPEHVKFILATTEPEKVLPTIHSRCQRYDFRNIPTREIAGHLKNICQQEGINADEDALLLVAKSGAGSMRDSLSLLDRLLSIGEKTLTSAAIEQLLGLPKSLSIHELISAIGEGNAGQTLALADQIISQGLSADSLLAAMIDHLRNLMIIKICGSNSSLVEASTLTLDEMNKQASRFTPPVLSQDIAILEELRRQMRQSGASRALFDAALVRLALSEQFTAIADLLDVAASAPDTQKKKFDLTPEPPSPPLPTPAPTASTAPENEAPIDDLPAVGKVWEGEKRSLSEIFKKSAKPTPPPAPMPAATPAPIEPSNIEPVDPGNLPAVWARLLMKVREMPALFSILNSAKLEGISDNVADIRLGSQHATFISSWNRNGKKDELARVLTEILDQPTGIKLSADESPSAPTFSAPAPAQTPRSANSAPSPEPTAQAPTQQTPVSFRPTPQQAAEFAKDPLIGELTRKLGAEIIRVSED